jgi:RNA polymerase sigma factor (sigma-70 family)
MKGEMTTDRKLLWQYAQRSSQEAFAELVRRHVNLVYGTARRQLCGNATLAEDVTQVVFTVLATRARSHSTIHNLAAWLFMTTRFTVSHTVRTERRRQSREQVAQSMHALIGTSGPSDAPDMPPGLLDEALEVLDEDEREAVLLRFLEGQSFAAIGQSLEVSEDAARMRVARALERIKARFAGRGIHSSAAALGVALAEQVVAAPPSLAANILTVACAGAAAVAAASKANVGIASIMTISKTTTLAWAIAAVGIAVSGYLYHSVAIQSAELARLAADRDELQGELSLSKRQLLAAVQSARLSDQEKVDRQRNLKEAVPSGAVKAFRIPARGPDPGMMDRLAKMKPQLEAGLPIKGAVVVLVDGKPVQRPVEFVMGKETRIDAVDDGIYVVTPALNEDGTVKYAISLEKKDPNGGPNQTETLPFVIQFPWEGFTLGSGGGRVIAFDPDSGGP